MIGDMSDVIEAFEHPVRIMKKGTGTLVQGMWNASADTLIDIMGVIINPMSGDDESLSYYAGLKITQGQLVLYTVENLKGTDVLTSTIVDVTLELEDKFLWHGKQYMIDGLIKMDQDCNVKGYTASEVNPKGD